jgi:acyl-CoA synthetase (AMP-forming)/AMP-acid ligase II
MQTFRNLTEVLQAAYTTRSGLWLPRNGADSEALRVQFAGYEDLAPRAQAYAAALQKLGLKRASRVAFAISAADELVALILGALHIGVVPVIFPVPLAMRELASFSQMLDAGVSQTDAELLITSRRLHDHLQSDQLLVGPRVRVMP